ncbi:protein SIEVE ELEMENT OCCLUSION B-like [Magnolia sinica]|uniref:protein SIEVE ELEMENT OCCLUSION B-like n=1 Tax=Magnolia sinica TaxID=86752 RepID=UPI0026585CCB|nr:protein SIEVE ELEMENT OCCLUSION B-like [Magnolia sinica]
MEDSPMEDEPGKRGTEGKEAPDGFGNPLSNKIIFSNPYGFYFAYICTSACNGFTTPNLPLLSWVSVSFPSPNSLQTMASQKLQLIKGERHLFSSSDDNAVTKQIQATHAPDGRDVDVRAIMHVVEDILKRATPTIVVAQPAHVELVEEKTNHSSLIGMLEALAYTIHRIACEITCKCSGGGDAHATTLTLLNSLSSYSWDAKVVLTLAAFAVSYGEFWLTAQLYSVNPLAKSVALLKQLPDILENTDALKPRFDAIHALINAMLDVTKCIIELKELPTEYISSDTPAMTIAMAHIPTAVYWAIRSIVACASQIIGLIGLGHEHISSTTEAWELSSLAHKVGNIHGHLRKQLELCHQHIDEKRHIEAYQNLIRLFEMIHIDNMKILRALLHSKDDMPLVDGATKKRVSVEVLRRKIVILFISDLDVSHDELMILTQIYNDTHHGKLERQYEIVWLPVIDKSIEWTDVKNDLFIHLASSMPWYSVHHPSVLEPAVIRFIKDVWHFEKKPMLVVLDAQGRVVCPNALHMMWIWGSLAFPFTSLREETLWKDEIWRLELLADEIDPVILQWVREGRYICLYGGEDIEWIRRFTAAVKNVIHVTQIPIEMVYVGKSNPKERVRKIIATIDNEKLSSTWRDLTLIWFFWSRLESMWHSKMLHGRTIENDNIMQEVMMMLTYDGSDHGWAVISKGSTEIVKSHGKTILDCLTQIDTWKANIELEGFIPALTNALIPYHTPEHCVRLILPGTTGKIPEKVVCAECKRPMEKYILYRCCTD